MTSASSPASPAIIPQHPAEIIAKLRERRQSLGLSHRETARRAGVQPADVYRWETGKVTPAFRSFVRWAAALGFVILAGCAIDDAVDARGKEMLARFQAISDADIAQARAWAFLNRDEPAIRCLDAIRVVVVQARSMTVIGPMTAFQMGMDITNPGGFLNIECAAERASVKARVQLFIGSTATLLAAFGL